MSARGHQRGLPWKQAAPLLESTKCLPSDTPVAPNISSMQLPAVPAHLAPDGSAIRSLLAVQGSSLAYCTLPAGAISHAVVHQMVEEIWYCLASTGQVWRRGPVKAAVTDIIPGSCITIPVGTQFQFRATGANELHLLIATMPPWPGAHEALYIHISGDMRPVLGPQDMLSLTASRPPWFGLPRSTSTRSQG